MSEHIKLVASSSFGLEAVVRRELEALGYKAPRAIDGRVEFFAPLEAVCRTNLWLRSAERVQIVIGEFPATDFGELFDRTTELPWSDWLPVDAEFPVRGKSFRSQLQSVRTCQSIVKKAIVENLKRRYQRFRFMETGPQFAVDVSVHRDHVTLLLDTTGPGLHKRGYRMGAGEAPLRETLAAALVQLSYWNPQRPLVDPFCGSATIPIEAALIARRIAPGLQRSFAAEQWPLIPGSTWREARAEARDVVRPKPRMPILGMDRDPRVLKQARRNARQAGIEAWLHLQQKEIREFQTSREYGCIITNPPYGERLGDRQQAEALYRDMHELFAPLKTWSFYILTSHPDFERLFQRRADRRRKLFNGRIPCHLYQFFGPKPPHSDASSPERETTQDSD